MKNCSDNSYVSHRYFVTIVLGLLFLFGGMAHAQVPVLGTHAKFTFPSKWAFFKTQKIDANTDMYLYYYKQSIIVHKGDTALPVLRIYVQKNYEGSLYDFVFDRYMQEPYQSLTDYTEGIGLPKSGGMGFVGAYTNVRNKKDYQFRMVCFIEKKTVVEFRLETTRDTYSEMEKEFVAILKSLTF